MPQRLMVQIIAALLANPFLGNFLRGKIYQGNLKGICVPVLNCYSCPAAVGSCPLGALQNTLAAPFIRFPFYVAGTLLLVGALAGRWVCGWLCPFGLAQDLLARISKIKKKIPSSLTWAKYAILGLLIALPILWVDSAGYGGPYFCQYMCPKGTLTAGIPLVTGNPDTYTAMVGPLFWLKIVILVAILVGSIFIYRPFCRTLCPLGAFFSFFNKYSLFQLHYDQEKCNNCQRCSNNCPVDLELPSQHNSRECIRCLQCRDVCRPGALSWQANILQSSNKYSERIEGNIKNAKEK